MRMRIVSLRVLTAVLIAAIPLVARADNGTLPDSATIQFYQEFLFEVANPATDGGTVPQQPYQQPQSLWTYFNYAHCECASPNYINTNTSNLENVSDPDHRETQFGWKLLVTPGMPAVHLPAEIWTGAMCDDQDDTTIRGSDCTEEGSDSIADIDQIYTTGGTTPLINIFDLLTPEPAQHATGECLQRALAGDEWIAVSTAQNGVLDFWQSQEIDGDTLPPPVPSVIRASGGENAVNLSWDVPVGDISDIYYYQALCIDESGNAAGPPVAAPLFQTARSLCGAPLTINYTSAVPTIVNDAGVLDIDAAVGSGSGSDSGSAAVRLAGSDAGVDAPGSDAGGDDGSADAGITVGIDAGGAVVPQPFQDMDPGFICGSTTSATATSMRIEGLTNGTAYHVALLAIDKSGNPAGVYLEATFTPQPVTDFWEDLHGHGSHVEGGFCLVNDTFGGDSGISSELRAFRDDTLAATGFGRWLTNVYYDDVAPLGAYVAGHTALRIWTGLQLSLPIAVAIAWHHVTLPGLLALFGLGLLWRNRRRVLARRGTRIVLATGAALAALVVVPGRARAQAQDDGSDWQSTTGTAAAPSDPDWQQGGPTAETPPKDPITDETPAIAPASIDEPIEAESALEPPRVNWHAGVKLAPYTPQIDAQLASQGGSEPGGVGPYKSMFGSGLTILPVLDVDRVVYHGLGGLFTAGVSVGYLGKSANAFTEVLDPTTGKYMTTSQRAGDTNSFRLIPISVEAGYRYTQLDDNYGIPIVPYIRAGLAYDVWWMDAPSGNLSSVCTDGKLTDNEPGCATNKAAGASAGVVGSIGLAIHAERIDPNAASAMRESGILHAGFYVELSLAKVDGFGSDTKLAVGDNTVFAGVDFDF